VPGKFRNAFLAGLAPEGFMVFSPYTGRDEIIRLPAAAAASGITEERIITDSAEELVKYLKETGYAEEARVRAILLLHAPVKLSDFEEKMITAPGAPAPTPERYEPRFRPSSADEIKRESKIDSIIADNPLLKDFRPILRELLQEHGSVEGMTGCTGLELGPHLKTRFLRYLRDKEGADVGAVDKAFEEMVEGDLKDVSHSVVDDYNEFFDNPEKCKPGSLDFVYSRFGLYFNMPSYAPAGETRDECMRKRFEPIARALKPGGSIISVYKLGEEDELLTEEEMRGLGLEGMRRYYENLPGSKEVVIVSIMRKSAPVSVPPTAAETALESLTTAVGEVKIDTIETRQAAIFAAAAATPGRGQIVKVITGVPPELECRQKINSTVLKINRSLAKNGFGIVKIREDYGSEERDERQVSTFYIYATDPHATLKSCRDAVKEAQKRMTGQGVKGRIVLFAPVSLAGVLTEEFGDSIIVVSDAYTDIIQTEEVKSFTDIVARVVLGRLFAACEEAKDNEPLRRKILNTIREYLGNIADGLPPELAACDDLTALLNALNKAGLRIKPINYNDLDNFQRSQLATAMSA
jgi:SAM-dependent methyltransferase